MKKILTAGLLFCVGNLHLFGAKTTYNQENTFTCDSSSYIFTSEQTANYTKALNIDMVNETITTAKNRFASSHINAIGFNPKDGFIYGWAYGEGDSYNYNPRVVRIDSNFNVHTVNLSGILPKTRFYLGDVSKTGIFYLANRHQPLNNSYLQEIQRVDLNTNKVLKKITLKQQNIFASDFAINPKDDMIYTVNAINNQLVRINPSNGKVTELGNVGITKPYQAYDQWTNSYYMVYPAYSVYNYFDRDGTLYFQVDGNTVFKINIKKPWQGKNNTKAKASYFKTLNTARSGDGARCALAGISQESDQPNLTISDASVVEGDSGIKNIVFTITADKKISYKRGLKLSYSLSEGSAKAGEDYKNQQGSFIMKGKTYTLSLPIIKGDTTVESDEDFFIHFTAPTTQESATFVNAKAKGTIIDNDRPKDGICYATTDNYNKLFIYDDLDEKNGLSNPKKLNLTEILDGEGGAYRAKDGYMYIFSSREKGGQDLKKIDLTTGTVSDVKKHVLNHHVDSAEFYYNPKTKTDVMYATDKHRFEFYTINTKTWTKTTKQIVDKDGNNIKISGLAIDPYSGHIYGTWDQGGWAGNEDEDAILYALDIQNNSVIATKLFTLKDVDAEGLAFANNGKLYLENEKIGDKNGEHKLYRVNLEDGSLTKVAHTGTKNLKPTDTSENNYVDIETLSCDGGKYQVAPVFTISQKEITIKEGNTNLKDGTNGKDINITIRANKPLNEAIKFTITQKDATAKQGVDYKKFTSQTFMMPKGKSSVTVSKHSIIADTKVENDEHFTCAFTPTVGEFKDGQNSIKINIIDDDQNTLDAYEKTSNLTDRVIKTHIVNAPFQLKIVSLQPNNQPNTSFSDMKNTKIKIVDSASCTNTATDLNMSGFAPFTLTGYGQLSPSFKVAKAYKRAKVQFSWEDAKTGEKKASCSTDEFAVRPDKYIITKPTSIKAGEAFNLIVTAVDAEDKPVTNYEENKDVYTLTIDEIKASSGCPLGTISNNNNHAFHHARSLIDLTYNDVGMLQFKINEKHGSEFAIVDSSDGSGDSRFIKDVEDTITIDASQFVVNFTYTTQNGHPNYTYYSANPNDMGAKIRANVIVNDASGNPLNNYTNGCYAKDVAVSLNYTQTGTGTVELTNSDTTPVSDVVSTGGKYSYNVYSTSFTNGIGSRDMYMNFGRIISTPKLPLTMKLSTPLAKIGMLTGMVNFSDKSIAFLYARAHGQEEQTGIGSDFTTIIDYEAYLPSSVDPTAYGLASNLSKGKDDLRWSILPTDTAFGYTSAKLKFQRATITATTATTVSIVADKTPHTNIITYDAKAFLDSTQESSGIKVILTSPINRWSGKGKTGKIFDDSSSKEIKKRMEW